VEDDAELREALAEQLGMHEFLVTQVETADAALERIKHDFFVGILLGT
jgi:DNA-binding response OmpR family regulator